MKLREYISSSYVKTVHAATFRYQHQLIYCIAFIQPVSTFTAYYI